MKDFRSEAAIDAAIERNKRGADFDKAVPGFMLGIKIRKVATCATQLLIEVDPADYADQRSFTVMSPYAGETECIDAILAAEAKLTDTTSHE